MLNKEQKAYYKYLHDYFDKIEELIVKTVGSKTFNVKGQFQKEIIEKIDFEKIYSGDKKYKEFIKKKISNFIQENILEKAGLIGEIRAEKVLKINENAIQES
jgi:hypothetical protein